MKVKANDVIRKRVLFQGLPIDVEWPKGSVRRYPDSDFERKMFADYGYLRDAVSPEDGEEIDVYVGDDPSSPHVFVIAQLVGPYEVEEFGEELGNFDEFKVMLGCQTQGEAEALFKLHTPADQMGNVWSMTVDEFKSLVRQLLAPDTALEASPEAAQERSASVRLAAFNVIAGPNRLPALQAKYPQHADVIADLAKSDPSGTEYKYLDWLTKQYLKFGEYAVALKYDYAFALGTFHRLSKYFGTDKYHPDLKNTPKDINSYASLSALANVTENAEVLLRRVEKVQDVLSINDGVVKYAIREFDRNDITKVLRYFDWALREFKKKYLNDDPKSFGTSSKPSDKAQELVKRIIKAYGHYHLMREDGGVLGTPRDLSLEDVEAKWAEYEQVISGDLGQLPVAYSSGDLTVYGPLTDHRSLCQVGRDTGWCVSVFGSTAFANYMRHTPGGSFYAFFRNGQPEALAHVDGKVLREFRDTDDEVIDRRKSLDEKYREAFKALGVPIPPSGMWRGEIAVDEDNEIIACHLQRAGTPIVISGPSTIPESLADFKEAVYYRIVSPLTACTIYDVAVSRNYQVSAEDFELSDIADRFDDDDFIIRHNEVAKYFWPDEVELLISTTTNTIIDFTDPNSGRSSADKPISYLLQETANQRGERVVFAYATIRPTFEQWQTHGVNAILMILHAARASQTPVPEIPGIISSTIRFHESFDPEEVASSSEAPETQSTATPESGASIKIGYRQAARGLKVSQCQR
jgi:hypothetical protein